MENNFVLPKTEESLNQIIAKIKKFFEISSLCFSGFYGLYTIFRFFFMPSKFNTVYLIVNILLSVVSWAIFILNLLGFLKKISVKKNLQFIFDVTKRIISLLIFVLVFISLFSSTNEILPYKILFTMFCGVGIIISIIGDIFNATFPIWTQTVLESFKSDIELSGLAERSLDKLKEELKKDEFQKKIATGALEAGSSLVKNMFKNLFKPKDKK